MKHNLLSEMIDRGVNVSAAMLINNPRAHSGYRIGLDNDSFSPGTIRYVAPEIRAVILKSSAWMRRRPFAVSPGRASPWKRPSPSAGAMW